MEENLRFLNMDGLDDVQVNQLRDLLHPSNFSSEIEFPWSNYVFENFYPKVNLSSLNVHAPAFEAYVPACNSYTSEQLIESQPRNASAVSYSNGSNMQGTTLMNDPHFYSAVSGDVRTLVPVHQTYTNGQPMLQNVYDQCVTYSQPPKPFNGDFYSSAQSTKMPPVTVSSFKLNPTVSSFIPQNIESFIQPQPPSNGQLKQADGLPTNVYKSNVIKKESYVMKSNEISEVKVNEDNIMKNYENNVMKSNENSVVKSSETSVIKGNDNSVIKGNEISVMKGNVSSVMKSKQSNVMKNNERSGIKDNERSGIKDNERSGIKDNERSGIKDNERSGIKDNERSGIKDNERSGMKDNENEFVVEQNASIENYAEDLTLTGLKQGLEHDKVDPVPIKVEAVETVTTSISKSNGIQESQQISKPARRSWADIVSRGQKPTEKVSLTKPVDENEKTLRTSSKDQENEGLLIAEDKMSLVLGKHLHQLELNFQPVLLQPRGLINRRNWCYINATLQALLGCPPFYTLLRNLPLGPGVERGKSSTPVIDSMVKVTYEFSSYDKSQEELQVGQPFQPDFIYDMLRDLKSDCLKGQQEDAEEFLSFILNGMHEEMVKIIKNYEKKNHLDLESEIKENGGISDGEEEWQVIGSKHKGMVTRKVAEHKTPISDLLGGQIKSFLTTSGNKTSASIQPFFTLQLDIQSENVTSVSEALKEMTIKEPIQGYTCAKTKQEVEAYSHIALQKLPPILILHLKRFVYNKNGGCKKVMKKTDYPLLLDINKDMFSPDLKKNQRLRQYKLFAVMYHDGEEAVKGHYISDVYNHGSQSWVRCDDRAVTAVTEEQVLSHSPPRVPYLLFYQES